LFIHRMVGVVENYSGPNVTENAYWDNSGRKPEMVQDEPV
jgi:hypothetical protein